ncbi:MAG: hypothetical protein J5I53_08865 [Bradyrhizobiaceae bacterium]|nr:hypothetical protein [Bradyrhizobiaceae bacterium]
MNRIVLPSAVAVLCLALMGCSLLESDDDGPNSLGGDPNLEMTKEGSVWDVSPRIYDLVPVDYEFKDDVKIVKNSNGVLTVDVKLTFDKRILLSIDTLAGTESLPLEAKQLALDAVLKKLGATIDTVSVPGMAIVKASPNFKATNEGIQEYVTSGGNLSKPFTIVKYNMNVGDSWSMTTPEGKTVTRKVVHKSTTDDYDLYFWRFKVFKVESVEQDDPLIEKVTYIANHKYGPFGAIVKFKNGNEFKVDVTSPTL